MPLADITELLRACHRLMVLPVRDRIYRPNPPLLWRVPDALACIRAALAELPDGGAPLVCFLPRGGDRIGTALASTLVAGLELGRDGIVALDQATAFGAIVMQPAGNWTTGETPASVLL